jgi:nitric oxide reductase NorD protein
LVGAGSLDGDVLATLRGHRRLARRYLAVEGHRALQVHSFLLPPAARRLIDRDVADRTDSPWRSLAIATSGEVVDEPPDLFGMIVPSRVRTKAAAQREPGSVPPHGPSRSGPARLAELEGDDGDEDPALDLLSSPVGGGGGLGRLVKRMFGDGRSSGNGPPGADAPTHWRRGSRPGPAVTTSALAASIPGGPLPGDSTGWRYPEWDVRHRRYRHDWCTVTEIVPAADVSAPLVVLDPDRLRRPLARLGRELQRQRRQLQGDDIDIDAVVEARVALVAGSSIDEAVYLDGVRCRRDLSVLVLLDVSGSAGEPGDGGASVHELQRAGAGALVSALHELGDRTACLGFRSQGRHAVHMIAVKRFDEGLDALVAQRLGGLAPGAYTRLGAAVRHATSVLERQAGTARRLLVVLSDGFAYDHGYERAYGEADARRALVEARRRGVGCVCLSIGAPTEPAALGRIFGAAAHGSVRRPEQLAAVVGPLFASALRSAELHRTMAQRRVRTRDLLQIERRTG